jgi:hypothetical protein
MVTSALEGADARRVQVALSVEIAADFSHRSARTGSDSSSESNSHHGYNSSFYDLQYGDIVQFRWATSGVFQHAMLINRVYYSGGWPAALYLTGHSNNYWDYPMSYFNYNAVRYLRIGGVLK